MTHCRGLLVALALVLLPAAVRAQEGDVTPIDRSFSIQLFEPAPGPDPLLTIESARTNGHLGVTAGLVLNYQHNPFSIFPCEPGTGGPDQDPCVLVTDDPQARVVESHLQADVMATLSLFQMFQVGLLLPVTLYQAGDGVLEPQDGEWVPSGLSGSTGLGDLRLHLKWTAPFGLGSGAEEGFGLAIAPVLSFPLGDLVVRDAFMGDGMVTVHPQVLLEYRWQGLQVGARVGYRWREESQIYSTQVGQQLTYAAGAGYSVRVGRGGYEIQPLVEVFGANGFSTELDQNPVEVDVALRARLAHDFLLTLGAGAGLVSAVGVPQFRTFLGFAWTPRRFDADGDGIMDHADSCPNEPEDMDGFEDSDGCPELDNDRDGMNDDEDRCPDDPEDVDDFEDDDGCPEPDNDGDGVPDGYDSCPLEPEDLDGYADDDGCPDLDHDGDNIPTPRDHCPYEPEDTDGYADDDGCPEEDFDGDGRPDDDDLCPESPEDWDGHDDDDGCADLDNDEDGIPDSEDECPNEPETLNGIADEDGCPDRGRTLVVITEQQIQIREQILFATDSDQIVGAESFAILDIVTRVLRGRPSMRVRIEGHTDDAGARDHNLDLSRRRAESVRQYFITHGIAAERLVAEGFGPDRPIQSNRTRQGRAANRRVEFHIVQDAPAAAEDGAAPAEGGAEDGSMTFSRDELGGE